MVSFRRRWDPKTESRLENKNSHAKEKERKKKENKKDSLQQDNFETGG
jgi:hypothetical protein